MDLNEFITFKKELRVSDGGGGYDKSLVDIETTPQVWANIKPISTFERYRAEQMELGGRFNLTLYARQDLKSEYLIEWSGDLFEITDVPPIMQGQRYMTISMKKK